MKLFDSVLVFSKKSTNKQDKTMQALWHSKQKRRENLAHLSIEEKVAILVSMQRAAYPILAKRKKHQL